MITESQQKTIDSLKDTFEHINALEIPPSDLMAQIDAELNKGLALKLKSEAALKAEESKAREMMTKYVDEVYRPVLNKFLPSKKVEVYSDGTFYLNESYTEFHIKAIIYEDRNEDKSKRYEFAGFKLKTTYSWSELTFNISTFDEAFKKWVIEVRKSIDKIYY